MLGSEHQIKFVASHLTNIRMFALWGLLDALIYFLAKGHKLKSAILYLTIFLTITIAAIYSPFILDLI